MAVLWDAARELLTVEEAARYLGVKQSAIYTWAWRKTIPSVRMDFRLHFDRDDLDKLRGESLS